MATAELIEVEVGGNRNLNHWFLPADRVVRGRFDVLNFRSPHAARLRSQWPEPIPGNTIGIDTKTRVAFIDDPLGRPQYTALCKKIEAKKGVALAVERAEFSDVDTCTWLHWMKRLVDSGEARVVSGVMPEVIQGEPRRDFRTVKHRDPRDERVDRLCGAVERLAMAFEQFVSAQPKPKG